MKTFKKINLMLCAFLTCFFFASCEDLFGDDDDEIAGCSTGYQGPDFDIQIDSQCKAAYAYKCQGNDQGVRAACDVYRGWQQHQSGIPNCPYCN